MVQLSVVLTTDDRDFATSVTNVLKSSGVALAVVRPSDDPENAPHVAIVDIRQERGGPEKVDRTRARWPGVVIIAVASASDPERILDAMRAGANEFFVWPSDTAVPPNAMQDGVRSALAKTAARVRDAARRGAEPARVLAFLGTKGGVGTTTIAVNCATELARPGTQPTLIVDLNQFIGEVGLFLGMRPRFTVVDALDSIDRLDAVFLKRLVATHKSGLDVIAGSELVDRPSTHDATAMEELLRILKQHYTNIILDAGGLTNPVAPLAMFAADASFLVTNPDVASIRNARRMVDRIRKLGVEPSQVRIVLNRTSDNPAFAPEHVQEVVGRPVEQTFPSDYRTVSEALNSGVPLTTSSNSSMAAEFGRFVKSLSGVQASSSKGVEAPARQPGQLLGLFNT